MNSATSRRRAFLSKPFFWGFIYAAFLVLTVFGFIVGQYLWAAAAVSGSVFAVGILILLAINRGSDSEKAANRFDASNLQAILEDLPVALIRLAPDGTIEWVNSTARSLLGRKNLIGKNISDEIEGLGRSMRVRVKESLKARGSRTTEMGRFVRNSKEVFLQVSLMAMPFGDRTCLVVVLSDKTELKVLEAQFVQSQKMQAVGQLAGGVAHDFNNLLTAISGHCDLLLLRHNSGDEDFGDLIQIRQNSNRAAALVRQLLAFSRKQTLRPKVLKLGRTLEHLSELLNRLLGEKVRLKIEINPNLKLVRVDERQFEQVIMNLVVNARDAMLDGGEVVISTQNVTLEKPLERDRATVPVGDYVSVHIRDTGVGIPPDSLPKIFEPFYTTKKMGEGTGLGLSTVYGIIKQTGGFVFVDSIPGKGTTFIVYLPAYSEKTASVDSGAVSHTRKAQIAPPEVANCRGCILLVEDEAPVRSFAARALKMRGYQVDEADCGESALEMVSRNGGKYDLYISDIIMPGMDGPTWVKDALVTYPDTQVIFMSGYAEDVFEDGKPDIENAGFLQKPFSLSELSENVQQLLLVRR